MKKGVVIIPTYNEAENIELLVDTLHGVFKKIPKEWEMHILVVDDSSPDGTAEIVKKIMAKDGSVHLFLNKEKVGLGGAYMKGMRWAIDNLKPDVMFEMDADFQHDENLIPIFLQKINSGADIVIGSRYIKGGSVPASWGLIRKILSIGGNTFTRVMMLNGNIHDWTTGFRALKPWVYEKVHNRITELRTYSFQISFLYYALKEDAKVVEVPLVFRERKKGESKLPGIEGTVKTLWFVVKTRAFDFLHSRFFKFGTVGFTGYLVNAITLRLLTAINTPGAIAWSVPVELSIISNFVLNNIWTFKKEKISGFSNTMKKFLAFNGTSLGALVIQTIAGTIGDIFFGIGYRQILLPFIIVFLVLPYNYFMYNAVIWKTWKLPWSKK